MLCYATKYSMNTFFRKEVCAWLKTACEKFRKFLQWLLVSSPTQKATTTTAKTTNRHNANKYSFVEFCGAILSYLNKEMRQTNSAVKRLNNFSLAMYANREGKSQKWDKQTTLELSTCDTFQSIFLLCLPSLYFTWNAICFIRNIPWNSITFS